MELQTKKKLTRIFLNKSLGLNSKKTIKHFPSSTREWKNSVYVYNKDSLNLMPVITLTATNMIKSYFSLFNQKIDRIMRIKRLLLRRRRLSSNKIFLSNGEFKHTNNKVIIILYLFNRQKNNYILTLRKQYFQNIFNLKKNIVRKHIELKKTKLNFKAKKNFIFDKSKRLFFNNFKSSYYFKQKKFFLRAKKSKIQNKLKFKKSLFNRIKLLNLRSLNYFKQLNKEKYHVFKIVFLYLNNFSKNISNDKVNKLKHLYIMNQYIDLKKHFSNYIFSFQKKFLEKSLKKLQFYLFFRQLIFVNKSKYNYTYLQYLKQYLYKLLKKNVEFNLINIKRFYLNSDILSESVLLKLTKKRNFTLKYLKNLKKKVKIHKKKGFLFKNYEKLNNIYLQNMSTNHLLDNKVIKNLKYRDITGFRVQAKGRLTRRYTASRSISKVRYSGNLINYDSSYNGLSAVLLKGNLKSNIQHTKLKSKTRIGSFGIKGWVSGN